MSEDKTPLSDSYLQYGNQPSIPLNIIYNGWQGDISSHIGGSSVTIGMPIPNMADNMAMFGGHRLMDSVFSKFYALPYGVGDKGGCVLSVVMTYAPSTGANCGAGGWDAVTEYELATNNPPWYMTGSSIKDENGNTHSVTFTENSAVVRPKLPESYQQFMHVGMHVLTNIVAGPTIYGGPSIDGIESHRNQDQQFYGNMLNTWSEGSDNLGTYTRFNMVGQWQPISGEPVDAGHVPYIGKNNTKSNIHKIDSLDKVQYKEFNSPVLVIGTYIKHFTRNTSCEVIVQNGTDGTAVKRYGPSRKCDEELDNWYTGPDYGATMHGLTIGAGFNNKVSNDSYGLAIAGPWPVGARVWLGSDGIDFDGDEYVTGSRKGSSAVVGSKKMIAQWWQEPTANIGYLESVNLWAQTDSISEQNNGIVNGPAANGQDISYWFGPRQSASKYHIDGMFESAIVFNPSWSKNGSAICGSKASGYFKGSLSGTACLTVGEWGDISTTGSVLIGNNIELKGSQKISKNITVSSLSGKGNAYACIDSAGKIYRSSNPCN